jgi:hypothetical protein
MVLLVLMAFKIPDSSGDELILKSMTCMIIVVAPAAEILAVAARTIDKGRSAL